VTLEDHARAIEAAIQAAVEAGFHLVDDNSRPLSRYGAHLEHEDVIGYVRSEPLTLPRNVLR
jgi:hypothetical protein